MHARRQEDSVDAAIKLTREPTRSVRGRYRKGGSTPHKFPAVQSVHMPEVAPPVEKLPPTQGTGCASPPVQPCSG